MKWNIISGYIFLSILGWSDPPPASHQYKWPWVFCFLPSPEEAWSLTCSLLPKDTWTTSHWPLHHPVFLHPQGQDFKSDRGLPSLGPPPAGCLLFSVTNWDFLFELLPGQHQVLPCLTRRLLYSTARGGPYGCKALFFWLQGHWTPACTTSLVPLTPPLLRI